MVRLRFLIFTLLIGSLLAGATLIGGSVKADQFDAQINALRQQNAANQQVLNGLAAQADSYQAAIDALQSQINSLQQAVVATQSKIDDLNNQITQAQADLDHEKLVLGENIKTMYLEGNISTLEILASSKDLSDFVNKQEYRNTVANKVKDSVDKINALKAELQKQQQEQKDLLAQQQDQQAQLQASQNQQNQMLAYNQSQQDAYSQQIGAANAQIASLRAQQAAAYRSLTGSNGNSPVGSYISYKNMTGPSYCGGGYGFCYAELDQWVPDSWGLHYARECVHYVANALANRGYYIPYDLFANGDGYAYQWVDVTTSSGTARLVSDPQPGDVVYFPIGSLGHVAIVDYVNSDGSLHVSQMNWYPGQYNTMDVIITSNLQFLRFHQ